MASTPSRVPGTSSRSTNPRRSAEWLKDLPQATVLTTGSGAPPANQAELAPSTFLARVRAMPTLVTAWGDHHLWPAQITAIRNLEKSLAQGRPRALIQMATGSGKTFTAISFIYRLIKYAGARRVLFLVDRGNLGRQTKKEFDLYVSPVNNFKFGEEYIVQHLSNNTLDKTARVVISTIQRMYSMLANRELPEDLEEASGSRWTACSGAHEPIDYNPAIPIETFDIIVTDEAHRSIYNLWRQVLEYFDASLIGLTATPSKQTFGFFNQNLVMEYGHEQAVADGVNVNYDVYRIRTQVSEAGGKVDAGFFVDYRDKLTPQDPLGRTGRRIRLRPQPARPRRGGRGPDPHAGAHLPRQAAHRDLPRPHRGAQDADLRQGRQPRRGHRQDRARGVRQGQRVRAEDHLPHHG